MRRRFIQHPQTLELVPAEEYVAPSRGTSWQVLGDIEPYRSMVTGEIIGSRSRHREHLRDHGMVEVGNEVKHLTRNANRLPGAPAGTREAVIQAYKQVMRKY